MHKIDGLPTPGAARNLLLYHIPHFLSIDILYKDFSTIFPNFVYFDEKLRQLITFMQNKQKKSLIFS